MESIAIQPVQLTITTAFPADSAIKFVFLPRLRRGRNVSYLANRNGNAVENEIRERNPHSFFLVFDIDICP